MASGVDGVALVYGRWRRRVHGVSVEYDVSVEYGVCYEAVVACAPKEQQIKKNDYLKITARLITHMPSIQQDWANYTCTYRDI